MRHSLMCTIMLGRKKDKSSGLSAIKTITLKVMVAKNPPNSSFQNLMIGWRAVPNIAKKITLSYREGSGVTKIDYRLCGRMLEMEEDFE